MADGPDPLGKRALYWLPVDEDAVAGDGAGADKGPVHGSRPVQFDPRGRHARPAGKHALFSAATPAGDKERPAAVVTDPLPPRGVLVITCSSCGSVSRVGLFSFLLLQLPVGVWIPGRTFDRWMTCPACRHRTWTSVTLAR
jgi:hypothetical protein